MSQLTYKDLLDWLGLSNWQFITIAIIIILLWPLFTSLWKMKIVGKVKVDRVRMEAFKCVYISYEGSYDDLGTIYSQAVEDFRMVFKFSNYFVIFYDDPTKQPQGAMSKAIIGVHIKTIENMKIGLFLSKFPQYKEGELPKSQYLVSIMPLTELSPILSISRVYPAIDEQLSILKLNPNPRQIMEIYHQNQMEPYMSVLMPTTNQQQFQLWYEPSNYSRVEPRKHK